MAEFCGHRLEALGENFCFLRHLASELWNVTDKIFRISKQKIFEKAICQKPFGRAFNRGMYPDDRYGNRPKVAQKCAKHENLGWNWPWVLECLFGLEPRSPDPRNVKPWLKPEPTFWKHFLLDCLTAFGVSSILYCSIFAIFILFPLPVFISWFSFFAFFRPTHMLAKLFRKAPKLPPRSAACDRFLKAFNKVCDRIEYTRNFSLLFGSISSEPNYLTFQDFNGNFSETLFFYFSKLKNMKIYFF